MVQRLLLCIDKRCEPVTPFAVNNTNVIGAITVDTVNMAFTFGIFPIIDNLLLPLVENALWLSLAPGFEGVGSNEHAKAEFVYGNNR